MTPPGAAGTAGDGYRATPAPHPHRATTTDHGERPRCRVCGLEAHEHGGGRAG